MDVTQHTNQSQNALLCPKGCGFHGNPQNKGMCSVCYKDFLQTQISTERVSPSEAVEPQQVVVVHQAKKKNRCFTCRKKIGLTGFDCRCGNAFCGMHRYAEEHDCTFDYKADAVEKLTKENPAVTSEKIKKI